MEHGSDYKHPFADSTLKSSRAVPHPSTNRALRRLTSEVRRDPVHSTWYGRQRNLFSATSEKLALGNHVAKIGIGQLSRGGAHPTMHCASHRDESGRRFRAWRTPHVSAHRIKGRFGRSAATSSCLRKFLAKNNAKWHSRGACGGLFIPLQHSNRAKKSPLLKKKKQDFEHFSPPIKAPQENLKNH